MPYYSTEYKYTIQHSIRNRIFDTGLNIIKETALSNFHMTTSI